MSLIRLLITLLSVIFVLETVIMLLLPHLRPYLNGLHEELVDSFLLACSSAPFIWMFVVRPLRREAVTEVMISHRLLAEEKEFAENLIQNSAAPTFVLDNAHCVICWNLACEELTGVKAAEVVGTDEHWKAFYHLRRPVLADFIIDGNQEEVTQFYQYFSRSNVVPGGIRAMGWFPEMNGSDRFIVFSAAPVHGKQGELIAVVETLEDITEQKRQEEKILQANSLLTATLEATADAIMVTDLEGRIVTYNRQFVEMWGIPESILDTQLDSQVLQVALPQLKRSDEYAACVREHYDTPDLESRHVYEFSDGRIFERYSKPQRIGEKIVGRVRCFRDITEQRNLEARLRHSQKMESIGTLAGGVAHDFNNILSAIIGYGSIIKMKMDEDDRFLPMIAEILAAADRAAGLTQSLLAFSRKQIMEPRAVDVRDIVKGVETLLQQLLRENIELRATVTDENCTVLADKGQIEQVLMNLATNARDSLPNGGILAISIMTADLDRDFIVSHGYGEPGRYALLTVSDTGTGMDEETRQRIFEPFFTTKEVGKGTGLGLSLAYGIIKQHNGYINCYSESGRGTTFRIYLPIIDAAIDRVSRKSIESVRGGTETILLAEDDVQVRTSTRKFLEQFGYMVIEAVDGNDALMQFRASGNKVQLALLDVIMPGINGKEVLAEMKREAPDLKVLFTSGYSADVFRCEEIGGPGVPFISKPANLFELLKMIRLLLDGKC
jgi:PAS domain S-box